MQTLSKVSIYNFKSCKKIEDIEFSDFTPLVGYNNAGKSNVLSAIQWVLKKSSLAESAFFDPSKPVAVEAWISGISKGVLESVGDTHRPKIEPFVKDGVIRIRREQATPGASTTEVKLRVRDPGKPEGDSSAWEKNPSGIDNAIAALFPEPISIEAMDDAGKDIGKFETGSTIGKLIAKLMVAMKQTQGEKIKQEVDKLRTMIEADGAERAPEFVAFDTRANEIVTDFFPGVQVKVHVPAPEFTTLFKAGTIKVYEKHAAGPVDGNGRDVSSLGHGAQRAIQMALIRQLAESAEASKGGRTLLLIDEPELYMHPQAVAKVRSALRKLSNGPYQVVFTTHSPLMIGREELGAVLVLCKTDANGTTKRKRLAQAMSALEKEAQSQLDELFSVEAAGQVLFSDRVILAEGKTERELVPDLFEALYGVPPADRRVGFVALDGSGNTAKCLKVLGQMGIPTRAVVDLDYAFRQAVPSKLLPDNDPDIAACRALCPDIAKANQVDLGPDGFFSKDRKRECFEALAVHPIALGHIASLHTKLKSKDVWLWTKGSIEPHLGLASKDYKSWHTKRKAVQHQKLGAVADAAGVVACLRWLAGE